MTLTRLGIVTGIAFPVLASACTAGALKDGGLEPPSADIVAIDILPDEVTLNTGESVNLRVSATLSDGTVVPGVPVTWTATGGTISGAGNYAAGQAPGAYQVIARQASGGLADTTLVTVAASPAGIVAIDLVPDAVTLNPGESVSLRVNARLSDGTVVPGVPVAWTATGGTVSAAGDYTAGQAPGAYRVIARESGGGLADTTAVTVAPGPSELPWECQRFAYSRLVRVATSSALSTAIADARPGDLILLANGTYANNSELRITAISGTPSQRITLCGTPLAVIDAGSLSSRDGLVLRDVSYWTFSGFTITNALRGVYAQRSSYNQFIGLSVHGIGQEAIHLLALSKANLIQANRIRNTGLRIAEYGEGIYIGSVQSTWCVNSACAPDASDSTIIIGNIIGPDVRAEHIDIKEGTSWGEITENQFDGHGMVRSQEWVNSWIIVQGNSYSIHHNRGTYTLVSGYKVEIHAPGWGNNNTFWANVADVSGAPYGFWINSGTTGNVVRCDNSVLNATTSFGNVVCQE